MTVLSRGELLVRLQDAVSGRTSVEGFLEWAWEQFSSYERGSLRFERGCRGVIFEVLAELGELDSTGEVTKEDLSRLAEKLRS